MGTLTGIINIIFELIFHRSLVLSFMFTSLNQWLIPKKATFRWRSKCTKYCKKQGLEEHQYNSISVSIPIGHNLAPVLPLCFPCVPCHSLCACGVGVSVSATHSWFLATTHLCVICTHTAVVHCHPPPMCMYNNFPKVIYKHYHKVSSVCRVN